jgi:phosphoadenosine phosphosulfate reductase
MPGSTAQDLSSPVKLPLSEQQLEAINAYLSSMVPEEILQWAINYLPGLYQTTAFGLTGLVITDMLSKMTKPQPPLIFLDTLYHFSETYKLVDEVQKRYECPIHIYKPEGCETVQDFEKRYGGEFWKKDEDTYDFLVKVCKSLDKSMT